MKAQTMRRLRQCHHYLGVFFAPAILFFAFSGMIQTIGWQDAPQPSGWISTIANVHKHQVVSMPKRPKPPEAPGAPMRAKEDHDHEHEKAFVPLKVFVLLLSLALMASTLLGVVIALNNRTTRRTSIVMLVLGTALPLLLLA